MGKQDPETFLLWFFDPARFPDLKAVRAFVRGPSYFALYAAVSGGVIEAEDSLHNLVLEEFRERARKIAIHIAMDLIVLGMAAMQRSDEPFRFKHALDDLGPRDPREVMALQCYFDSCGTWPEETREPFMRELTESLEAFRGDGDAGSPQWAS